nr:immunoglobulin light chain junction region [Macaca mulatta]MOX69714.1 immunoglobulin light chain junction region [Macaca mulatta]MOX72394.1 immunoglobulin light chain junction region [Macaca mulatta]MOX79438.1 immunoglobulin light chain junction region [Macaca mulatta]MOX80999.1 immunoglobulin light chain junction region [Macaca mulatta]
DYYCSSYAGTNTWVF